MGKSPDTVFDRDPARRLVLGALKKAVNTVLDRDLQQIPGKVLEVGCGTGFFSRNIAKPALRRSLIGMDIDRSSLDIYEALDPRAQLVRGSINNLPFPEGSLDAVIGFSTYYLFEGSNNGLEESMRVLKPKGRMIIFQDSGLVEQSFARVGLEELTGNGIQGVEDSHTEMLKRIKALGLRLVSGQSFAEAAVATKYEATVSNFTALQKQNERIQRQQGVYLAGITMDRGHVDFHGSPLAVFRDYISMLQVEYEMSPASLSSLRSVKRARKFLSIVN